MYEGMEDLKKVQLELLIEFDKICRENKLNYQLFSGTLLGAVRHSGFIPWDDDIDVCMLRKDYEKFIEISKGNINQKYFLQTFETDKFYMHNYAKLRKNGTLIIDGGWPGLEMHRGIFIDIFPMDKVAPEKIVAKIQKQLLFIIKKIKPFKSESVYTSSRNKLFKYVKIIIFNLLRPFSLQTLNRLQEKISRIYQNQNTVYSTALSHLDNSLYHSHMIENDDFYNTIEVEFEGHLFPAPKNYDLVLTRNFGDYMTPPKSNDQKPHHGITRVVLDVDDAS